VMHLNNVIGSPRSGKQVITQLQFAQKEFQRPANPGYYNKLRGLYWIASAR
jgi:hypothetical protein